MALMGEGWWEGEAGLDGRGLKKRAVYYLLSPLFSFLHRGIEGLEEVDLGSRRRCCCRQQGGVVSGFLRRQSVGEREISRRFITIFSSDESARDEIGRHFLIAPRLDSAIAHSQYHRGWLDFSRA